MYKIIQFFALAIAAANLFFAAGCAFSSAKPESSNADSGANKPTQTSKRYNEPKRIAVLQDDSITESSGLAVSQKNPGAFWTHNDSGGGAFLYAFDKSGKRLGTWKIPNAKNVDWEDLAVFVDRENNESYLLVADTGNNERNRSEAQIYRVREPQIADADKTSTKKAPLATETAEILRVEYPDKETPDAETLLVNPQTGDIYIVGKTLVGSAKVYKLFAPQKFGEKQRAEQIAQIGVPSITPGFLSGGAISPDGKRMILSDYFAAYEYVLSARAKNFDEIFKAAPEKINLGERKQGEAVAFAADNSAVYATSEKRPTPLIEVRLR